ncbi:hypothetical protein [Neobacillus vireti]|uniref:hypothetical protein n=1 Tax=Neobacillus vireti TaxID=220686 RepID=UPI002FFD6FA1
MWKIPFYWAIVHVGVTGEVILKHTAIFEFKPEWDLWDSYTLWWLYFLLFERLGEKIVPPPLSRFSQNHFGMGDGAGLSSIS